MARTFVHKKFYQNLQVNYNKTVRDATDDYSISLLSLCVPDKCTPKEVGMFFVWGHLADMQIVNFPEVLPCMMKDSNTTFRAGDIVFTWVLQLLTFHRKYY